MQITVKFLGPTNTKGSRYKATFDTTGQSVTIPNDYASNDLPNRVSAAKALVAKLRNDAPDLPTDWVATYMNNGDVVFAPASSLWKVTL